MRATIIHWDPVTNSGLLSSSDGRRASFSADAWRSADAPQAGREVDFAIGPGGEPADIYMLPATIAGLSEVPEDPVYRQAMTYAIIALVCGGFAFLLGPVGFLPGIPAIIFGQKGRRLGRDLPDRTPYMMSLVGFILGIVFCVLSALFLGFFLTLFSTVFWLAPQPIR